MGYYTHYELVVHSEQDITRETEIEINRAIAAKIHGEDPSDISDEAALWCLSEELKWYDHESDMLEISKQFPNFIFVLYGEGEEYDDVWCEYFANGECEEVRARIVYPEPLNPKFKGL